jgi:hypothetical protein
VLNELPISRSLLKRCKCDSEASLRPAVENLSVHESGARLIQIVGNYLRIIGGRQGNSIGYRDKNVWLRFLALALAGFLSGSMRLATTWQFAPRSFSNRCCDGAHVACGDSARCYAARPVPTAVSCIYLIDFGEVVAFWHYFITSSSFAT